MGHQRSAVTRKDDDVNLWRKLKTTRPLAVLTTLVLVAAVSALAGAPIYIGF